MGPAIIRDHNNGYIVLYKEHPYYGVNEDSIPEVDPHGGFTFANYGSRCLWSELADEYKNDDYWILGWDTNHWNDIPEKWTYEKVQEENNRLVSELWMIALKYIRNDERT